MRWGFSLKAACAGSKVWRSSGMRITQNFWNLPGLERLQSTPHPFHGVFTCFHLSCPREKGWSLKTRFVFVFPTQRHHLAVMFTPDNQMSEGNSGARKLEQCGAPTQTTSPRIFSFQHKTQGNAGIGTKAVRDQGVVSPRAKLKRTQHPKKAVYGFPGA